MSSVLYELISGVFGRLGMEVLPKWRMDHRLHELSLARHLQKVFPHLDVDLVLDVGANAGQYRDFLRSEVGYTGTIVSFEPIPERVAELRARAGADQHWEIRGHALGAVDGELQFNVAEVDQFSSFLTPDSSQVPEFRERNKVARTEVVQVRRLDSVFEDIVATYQPRGIYLKLDTQGYDLEVLKGGQHSLPRVRGLQSEISVVPIYDRSPAFHRSLQALQDEGFDISDLFIVARDEQLRAIEFDCVMLNRSLTAPRGTPA